MDHPAPVTRSTDGGRVVVGDLPVGYDLGRTVRAHVIGRGDPTARFGPDGLWRATRTPDGPGTLHLERRGDELFATAWGPGAAWILDGVPALAGLHRAVPPVGDHHPVVTAARRRHPGIAVGASRGILHALVPAVLGQRVTGLEAARSWAGLCRALGEPAPGPAGLLLPPAPERLAAQPSWWFHRLGVERKRAEVLRRAAAHAGRLEALAGDSPVVAAERLASIPGIGTWTVAETLGPALGDLDAVPVGDYHLKHVVTYALTGAPRGTDARMLELLAPWQGVRGVVLALLRRDGWRAPAFGPRQRIVPIASR